MSDRLNKTSICSVVFLDIIEYSIKAVSEQIAEKTLFNSLVSEALKDIAQNDRIILDTGDGAAIALMGEPEEALFVSLSIRDAVLDYNKTAKSLINLRIGINLGSVRVVKDINGQLNILGDGINVAQRIMSFAEPNQIMVSRSYFEVTSRLTKEITSMFTYSGLKQDKHVREHEVYLINLSAIPTKSEVGPTNAQAKPLPHIKQAKSSISAKAAIFTSAVKSNIKALTNSTAMIVFLRKYILWLLPILALGIILNIYYKKNHIQENQAFTLEVINSIAKAKAENKTVPSIPINTQVPVISPDAEPSVNQVAIIKPEEKMIVKSKREKKHKIAKQVDVNYSEPKHLNENKIKLPERKIAEHKQLEHKLEVKKVLVPVSVTVKAAKVCTTGEIALNQCK